MIYIIFVPVLVTIISIIIAKILRMTFGSGYALAPGDLFVIMASTLAFLISFIIEITLIFYLYK